MISFFFFLQIFHLYPSNQKELLEISMEVPVLVYFLIPTCPDCRPYNPIWDMIKKEYDGKSGIILGEADCRQHRDLRRYYGISWVPSFVTFFNNSAKFEKIEPTYESMNKIVQKLMSYQNHKKQSNKETPTNSQHLDDNFDDNSHSNFNQNPAGNTENNSNQDNNDEINKDFQNCSFFSFNTAKYPAFLIGNGFSDPCKKINDLQQKFPEYKDHFYLTKENAIKGIVYLNKDKSVNFEGNKYSNDFDKFIYEFTFETLGNWPISKAENVSRRIAFFIYGSESQLNTYQHLAKNFEFDFLFGKMHRNEFQKMYSSFLLPDSILPVLAIANVEKTFFTLLKNKRGFNNVLKTINAGKGERMMDYSLKKIFPNLKHDYTRVYAFTVAAMSVITFTAIVIIHRARKCIVTNRKYMLLD
ncbi:hypothetical protein TRFO_27278 [Tritrichomonas foetus]|uniref:Thioredoxin domain-containing protein n=1 Tax=Tritrichomonas foetus TaxID=1144522 RepID=A0A1J4K143_9EUKA|nr:hypothetical protein TRFO_27278 [Tritrichomonas foetus]|eukprot:OHT05145.1 hypothetical protein TRFO_27278 [Tritrichomonas foetus]